MSLGTGRKFITGRMDMIGPLFCAMRGNWLVLEELNQLIYGAEELA